MGNHIFCIFWFLFEVSVNEIWQLCDFSWRALNAGAARPLNVNQRKKKNYMEYFCTKTHLLSPLEKNISEKRFF